MLKKPTLTAKVVLFLFLLSFFQGFLFVKPTKLESANLTSVSDTLSNNRLSFRGEVEGAHAAGASIIALDSSPESSVNTSSGSASLMGNESVQVGTNNAPNTVKTIESDTRIVLSAGIANAVNDAAPVFATVSAVHTVRFTPVSAVNGGAFRALIPASTGNNNDGIPDKNGFDFPNAGAPTVSCTGGGSNISFTGVSGTATASAIQVPASTGTWFHSFECRYNGTGASPAEVTMQIGTAAGYKLINPSPANTTRYPGQADTYTFRVRHAEGIAGSYTTVDESLGTVGVVEAVRVTATVAPILTFTLTGVAISQSICGFNTSAASTPISVPFGTLTANNVSINHMAQLLTVSTNAAGGYSVTASESAALTALNLTGTPTIPDTTCAASACTVTTAQDWTSTSYTGFGYSLQDVSGDAVTAALEYNNGGAAFKARPFGSTGNSIMSGSGTTDADQAYVCYRIVVSGSQAAGDYENYVIYIATATF